MSSRETNGVSDALARWREYGLDALIGERQFDDPLADDPWRNIVDTGAGPLPPVAVDLLNLYELIRERRVLTILEFGCGWSTLVMAAALKHNLDEHVGEFKAANLRCLHPFKLFGIDADKQWIKVAYDRLPEDLRSFVELKHSGAHLGEFNGRMCSYYNTLPDVTPDFIYLDAPGGDQVAGELNGLSFSGNPERTIIAADLLRMEPTLTPGTMIVVDGRMNKVYFLRNNFQRNWKLTIDRDRDISFFELRDPPLGKINADRLRFHGVQFSDELP